MCGIHATISRTPPPLHSLPPELERCLRARGPDHFGQVDRSHLPQHTHQHTDIGTDTKTETETDWSLRFTSTVLALRGDHVARQPLTDDARCGSVLCWNGEAWRVGGGGAGGEKERVQGNDGEVVFGKLTAASSAAAAGAGGAGGGAAAGVAAGVDAVLEVLRGIEGPFAFVYYDAGAGRVFFGRDRLGRRSLLRATTEGGGLALCSVAGPAGEGWEEVEADGVYVVTVGGEVRPERHDWVVGEDAADFVSGIGRFNRALPTSCRQLTAQSPSVVALKEQLLESLRLRILNIPLPPAPDANGKTRVAVLFSGGLDCTVLARLCHDILDADQGIDLLNVAFENPRVVAQLRKENGNLPDFYEACPDRITGRKSFAELQKVCPGRAFRFVAAHRQQVISLIHPHNTEMDLSIAYALYFASRGQGFSTESPDSIPTPCTSPARVLLSGLGADELFGGYSRHPSAFQQRGHPGLIDELLLDVGRLGKRNLGRDDRVMAHWGKEVRFPFLDERLVRWAIETPAWEKCDFENGDEVSGVEAGKRILRLLALELGMENVAKEKKRAIQFGSRTAKMESGKVKGTTLIS
ncbi:asparagine synthase-domain-containing protein [Parachaetomium inaequale]|uniref:Asparagine synthase-domain-containing protein n=1 Tax=Parachaetomium inaequale TaxID=2588326 RepID=A0AAN6PEP5_9PEZI|nr:asparagine synthase-domain-containing protein [Parachaetomium inaequale]